MPDKETTTGFLHAMQRLKIEIDPGINGDKYGEARANAHEDMVYATALFLGLSKEEEHLVDCFLESNGQQISVEELVEYSLNKQNLKTKAVSWRNK